MAEKFRLMKTQDILSIIKDQKADRLLKILDSISADKGIFYKLEEDVLETIATLYELEGARFIQQCFHLNLSLSLLAEQKKLKLEQYERNKSSLFEHLEKSLSDPQLEFVRDLFEEIEKFDIDYVAELVNNLEQT